MNMNLVKLQEVVRDRKAWHAAVHGDAKSQTQLRRRQWQPTLVLLPGKCHGRRSLVNYSPWDCKQSHKTEQLLLTNLDSVLKSRDINLPTKFHTIKAMVFLKVMHGWESWTIKEVEN